MRTFSLGGEKELLRKMSAKDDKNPEGTEDTKSPKEIIDYTIFSHPLAALDEHSDTAYCNNVNNLNDCGEYHLPLSHFKLED